MVQRYVLKFQGYQPMDLTSDMSSWGQSHLITRHLVIGDFRLRTSCDQAGGSPGEVLKGGGATFEAVSSPGSRGVWKVVCFHYYLTPLLSTIRMPDDKYMFRLPFLSSRASLGESKGLATQRLLSLERKMAKNPVFADKYREFMREYEQLGHMSVSDFQFNSEHFIISRDRKFGDIFT